MGGIKLRNCLGIRIASKRRVSEMVNGVALPSFAQPPNNYNNTYITFPSSQLQKGSLNGRRRLLHRQFDSGIHRYTDSYIDSSRYSWWFDLKLAEQYAEEVTGPHALERLSTLWTSFEFGHWLSESGGAGNSHMPYGLNEIPTKFLKIEW